MNGFKCDGEGVVVGVECAVRERTNLRDGEIYTGTIVAIDYDEDWNKPSPYDTVYVMNDVGVYVTHRHCVHATEKNIRKLMEEIKTTRERIKASCEKERIRNSARTKSLDAQMPYMKDDGTFPAISVELADRLSRLTMHTDASFEATEALEEFADNLECYEMSLRCLLDDGHYYVPHNCCGKCKEDSAPRPPKKESAPKKEEPAPAKKREEASTGDTKKLTLKATDATGIIQITIIATKDELKTAYKYLKDNGYKSITVITND